MLEQDLKTQLAAYLQRVTQPFEMVASLDDSETAREMLDLLQTIVDQARYEPGWVEYDITNPLSGQVQTKMSYVLAVDDLYVGCGVYKNLVAAQA